MGNLNLEAKNYRRYLLFFKLALLAAKISLLTVACV
jgi:hypothetical protein